MKRLICWILVLLLPAISWATPTQERIKTTQEQLEKQRRSIEEAKRQEAALAEQLRATESQIQRIENDIAQTQQAIHDVAAREAVLREELEAAHNQTQALTQHSARLARILWSATLSLSAARPETWAEADREGTWLAAVLRELRRTRAELALHEAELQKKRDELAATSRQLATQQQRLATLKNELLRKRLDRMKQAETVRAQRLHGEAQLQSLLSALEKLRQQAALEAATKVSAAKGKLPWPAQGRIVSRFSPNASPPASGIGLATSQGERVRTIAAGKIVHSDAVRGLGHVVIVYHGETYYSVYAFLVDVQVTEGQGVAQGDTLGTCGFYPKAQGPGMYFELRTGAKPLDPLPWLAPRS
jgi:septal ring factor EnvC (AmiA/AmiB activator)